MTDMQDSQQELATTVEAAFSPLHEHGAEVEAKQAALRQKAAREFIVTKQHRRFVEFCDAVRRDRYIGLCHGAPGVGKTLSARHYAHWGVVSHYLQSWSYFEDLDGHGANPPAEPLEHRAIVYTPKTQASPKTLDKDLYYWHDRLSRTVENHLHSDRGTTGNLHPCGPYAELLIIDEADRLNTAGLETLRDHHDRTGIGLILIGMPGIERRLARYPQLYSRVGFLHHYQPLSADEQTFVLTRRWPELGLDDTDDFTTNEARAAIIRTTGGNFRLTTRLVAQIHRIMEINQVSTVTSEVVDTARESLVIGVP
jgi:DNA transposition AAA+ family ATPase